MVGPDPEAGGRQDFASDDVEPEAQNDIQVEAFN
jgi:hypothetical protein